MEAPFTSIKAALANDALLAHPTLGDMPHGGRLQQRPSPSSKKAGSQWDFFRKN
jgi:hypothetical protein